MLFDGLKLAEQSKATNLTVDSGVAFPSNANAGELFFLSTDSTLYTHNGTQWQKLLSIKDSIYDVSLSYPSDVSADEVVMIHAPLRTVKFVADENLHIAKALSAATTRSVFTIKKNNTSVGTITFEPNENNGLVEFITDTTFILGDVISIVAPSTSPHGKLTITLRGVLT
jgi:hypothetical protein